MVAMENPTCIARLVQFEAVAVATQPRFYHIQHLNEVDEVAQLDISTKWLEQVEALFIQQNLCIFTVVMKVSDK